MQLELLKKELECKILRATNVNNLQGFNQDMSALNLDLLGVNEDINTAIQLLGSLNNAVQTL